jgi:hypothetical protein
MATLLSGSWRRQVAPTPLSQEELDTVLPLVIGSGTTGLAWRRIRSTALASSEAGDQLRQSHVVMAVEAALNESRIENLLAGVADADQILIKGWAHARLFPVPGLRPYGDIDLRTRPDRMEELRSIYASLPMVHLRGGVPLDLQSELVDLPDRSWSEIVAHSRLSRLRRTQVRILGPEDALRLCCLHLLRHAIEMPPRSNPIWLCDASVMLEEVPPEFDWDYCLAGRPSRTQWMLSVIQLAHLLLGARIDRCPNGLIRQAVPGWMAKTFLRIWGHQEGEADLWPLPQPLGRVKRDVRALPRALAERWPTPLQSVFRLSWPINPVSGPVAQVLDYLGRALAWGPRHMAMNQGRSNG